MNRKLAVRIIQLFGSNSGTGSGGEMHMDLNGRTVLVTGASEGIGRATALLFARQGCRIVACARNRERLEELRAEINAMPRGFCDILPLDVSDNPAALRSLQECAEAQRVDIAIVNAGIGQYGRFVDSGWQDVAPLLRTNIDGALATVRAVLPQMTERGTGSVVLISSALGKRAAPYNAAYCASKYALHGFADALRLEARPAGVHIGVVCPSRTETRFFDRMTYSTPQRTRREVPTSSPEQVAAAVLRCVLRRRREIVVSWAGRLFAFVGHHFPRLTDFILYHSVPRPPRPAEQ